MITFANAALLSEYLRSAERAHREYVHGLTGGALRRATEGWADWYANYIDARQKQPAKAEIERLATELRPIGTVQVFTPGDVAPTRVNIPAQGKAFETKLEPVYTGTSET